MEHEVARQHHICKSPYYRCSRCGVVRDLEELEYQEGLLLCKTGNCFDTQLPQQRDAQRIQAIQAAASQPDAQPDDKLLNPATQNSEDILFSQ